MAVKIGKKDIAFIKRGNEVLQPDPVRDGLVLWYDFMGRKNTDAKRGIAGDLSGNGNHGTLNNFAYSGGSGYEDKREIEGRNLLRRNYRILANNQTVAAHFLEEFEGHHRIKAILNQSGAYGGISTYLGLNPGLGIPAGNTTLSVLVKPENDCRIGIVGDTTSHKECKAGEWTKLIARYTTVIDRVVWGLVSTTTPVDSWIEFKDFKLELGTEATPWRPAMEDPEYNEWAKDKGFKRGLKFDGVDDYTGIPKVQFGPSEDWTAMFTLDFSDNAIGSWMDFLGSGSTSTVTFHATAGFSWYMTYVNSKTHMINTGWMVGEFLPINTKLVLGIKCEYINGQAKITFIRNDIHKTILYNVPPEWKGFAFSFLGNSHRLFKGNIYSTLIYNRALTPEEIAHNYAIEKERWKL